MPTERPPGGPAGKPVLRVVRGDASPEEIAALTAVLITRTAGPGADDVPLSRPTRSAWSDKSRLLRAPVHPGPGAWRRSALPG